MEQETTKKRKTTTTANVEKDGIKWENKRMESLNSPLQIVCTKCKNNITVTKMDEHIKTCLKSESASAAEYFILKVRSNGCYFLYIAARPSAKLREVDEILRDTWLDCCGHLSAFHSSSGDWTGKGEMNIALSDVVSVGTVLEHEYDMGSTTESGVEVIAKIKADLPSSAQIVGRNKPIVIACAGKKNRCKNPATTFDSEEFKGFCDDCGEDGAEILDSPRMGVCGYGV